MQAKEIGNFTPALLAHEMNLLLLLFRD